MVKRQKEKQYQSFREHRANSQLRAGTTSNNSPTIRRLPFDCCALSLTPYTNPVCHPTTGIIFDNSSILPHLLKHKTDPVTGKPMTSRDLITLHMDKDVETQKWQCPVLSKPFSDYTKIVAILQHNNPPSTSNEANVYSYEAFMELNVKPKNYVDLISGKKFHRVKDVIVLQDPQDEEQQKLRDIGNFAHIRNMREEEKKNKVGGGDGGDSLVSGNVKHSVTASRIMDKIKRKRDEEEQQQQQQKKRAISTKKEEEKIKKKPKIYTNQLQNQTLSTTGACSGSFTSTSMYITNQNTIRLATDEEILQSLFYTMKQRKQKGFVRLTTTLGVMDVEIHADIVPRTAMNFIQLVVDGRRYDGCLFHRSIRNFMIQGGKPCRKGEKEASVWGGAFEDEFDDRLTHSGPGILSMANAGPATNKRQFFITYKSAPHLDRKHSVFGRVIKGLDVLKAMEQIPTDKKDRPKQEIKIVTAELLGANPVKDAEEAERVRMEERAVEIRREKELRRDSALGGMSVGGVGGGASLLVKKQKDVSSSSSDNNKVGCSSGIGKYLPKNKLHNLEDDEIATSTAIGGNDEKDKEPKKKKKKKKKSGGGEGLGAAAGFNVPSRLPPPPKKTTFGDFSGW